LPVSLDMRSLSRPRTILIVDDDASVRLTLSRMLRLAGYDVLTAITWKPV